jgi:hypothetical protein
MEAAASAGDKHAPTLANILKQARLHQSESRNLMRQITESSKGMKAPARKASSAAAAPRKPSDGQRRWQAFQKFFHAKLQKTNPNVTFKNAMAAAGPFWSAGKPTEEYAEEFEKYLEENPILSAENELAARTSKANEAKQLKALKKLGREKGRANNYMASQVDSLTFFESTLLTKMDEINDNVINLMEIMQSHKSEGGAYTRKQNRKANKSRKNRH